MKLVSSFTFFNPTTVIFGAGKLNDFPANINENRICLVTTPGFTRRGVTDRLVHLLGERLVHVVDTITPNPELDDLDAVIDAVREARPDAVLALGGGSAIDSGKIIAKAITAPAPWSLAAHFRQGVPLHDAKSLPCYAVATTSGTGAEVTPFATVWDGLTKKKYSLANKDMFPVVALIDTDLMQGMPKEVTFSTGLDAISQALESVWNRGCNEITLGLAINSLRLSLDALGVAGRDPANVAARSAMAQASLLAGLCISQTRTALAHSISYPLTARFGLPHGFACSFTLPALLDFNGRLDDGRLGYVASALGHANLPDFRNKLISVLKDAETWQAIVKYVVNPDDILDCLSEMITPSRSDNNMRSFDVSDIRTVIEKSIMYLCD